MARSSKHKIRIRKVSVTRLKNLLNGGGVLLLASGTLQARETQVTEIFRLVTLLPRSRHPLVGSTRVHSWEEAPDAVIVFRSDIQFMLDETKRLGLPTAEFRKMSEFGVAFRAVSPLSQHSNFHHYQALQEHYGKR